MGKQEYQEYLKTPEWAELRKRVLRHYGDKCMVCGSVWNNQVHHIRYANVRGEEGMEDFKVLCWKCHKKEHGLALPLPKRIRKMKEGAEKARNKPKKRGRKRKKRRWDFPKERKGGPVRINENYFGNTK